MSKDEDIQKKLDKFLEKLTETVFNGVQEKTKEISNLHVEIRNKLNTLSTDVSGINQHLEKLNSKVATHEKSFGDIAIKHARDDEQIKNMQETIKVVKNIGYTIIITVVLAVVALVIKK
jgi:predicted nuclease with TOPRIM domain